MSLSWRRFIWRSWKNVFEAWELFWSSLRSLRTFECHCVLLCTTLLRRRVTELSNLCGLAQVRAVKKSCHAALVFSQNIPSQRVTDLEAAIRQLRQISCILDSCTISASYEVSQAQKAILLLPHTAKGASTSSEELRQILPRTDDEHNLPYHEDYWQED